MSERKVSVLGILALLIGISGLGLGGYSIISNLSLSSQINAPEDISVHVINPDGGEIVSGQVSIEAIVIGSDSYSISMLRNGTSIGSILPLVWDTAAISDGWWNITVIIQDDSSAKVAEHEVIVFVLNNKPASRAYRASSMVLTATVWHDVDFNVLDYDIGSDFNMGTDEFVCPYKGIYLISGRVTMLSLQDGEEMHLVINKNGVGFVSRTITHASHTGPISANVVDILSLDKGDTIKLRLFHDGAGARTLYGTTDGINTYLSIAAIEILDIA